MAKRKDGKGDSGEKSGSDASTPKPEEAKAVFEQTLAQQLKDMGVAPGPDGKIDFSKVPKDKLEEQVPKLVLGLLSVAVERFAKGGSEASESTELQDELKNAFQGYMLNNVLDGKPASSEIRVDGDFMKAHVPGLMSTMLQTFAKVLVPKEVEIPISPEGAQVPDASPQQTVTLKFDFSSLFTGAAKGSEKPEPEE